MNIATKLPPQKSNSGMLIKKEYSYSELTENNIPIENTWINNKV